jgi:hypothetical protein
MSFNLTQCDRLKKLTPRKSPTQHPRVSMRISLKIIKALRSNYGFEIHRKKTNDPHPALRIGKSQAKCYHSSYSPFHLSCPTNGSPWNSTMLVAVCQRMLLTISDQSNDFKTSYNSLVTRWILLRVTGRQQNRVCGCKQLSPLASRKHRLRDCRSAMESSSSQITPCNGMLVYSHFANSFKIKINVRNWWRWSRTFAASRQD